MEGKNMEEENVEEMVKAWITYHETLFESSSSKEKEIQ